MLADFPLAAVTIRIDARVICRLLPRVREKKRKLKMKITIIKIAATFEVRVPASVKRMFLFLHLDHFETAEG